MPMDRKKYPKDWERISREIRERSGGRCECRGECGNLHECDPGVGVGDELAEIEFVRCPARQGKPNPITDRIVILTVAHLNHTPADCRPENLRAMCQRCHLSYDRERHQANARRTRRARRATGDLFEPDGL